MHLFEGDLSLTSRTKNSDKLRRHDYDSLKLAPRFTIGKLIVPPIPLKAAVRALSRFSTFGQSDLEQFFIGRVPRKRLPGQDEHPSTLACGRGQGKAADAHDVSI